MLSTLRDHSISSSSRRTMKSKSLSVISAQHDPFLSFLKLLAWMPSRWLPKSCLTYQSNPILTWVCRRIMLEPRYLNLALVVFPVPILSWVSKWHLLEKWLVSGVTSTRHISRQSFQLASCLQRRISCSLLEVTERNSRSYHQFKSYTPQDIIYSQLLEQQTF